MKSRLAYQIITGLLVLAIVGVIIFGVVTVLTYHPHCEPGMITSCNIKEA